MRLKTKQSSDLMMKIYKQEGGGTSFPIYRSRGSGFFGNIFKMGKSAVVPALKNFSKKVLIPQAKKLGKKALEEGIEIISGQSNPKASLKRLAKSSVDELRNDVVKHIRKEIASGEGKKQKGGAKVKLRQLKKNKSTIFDVI